MTLSEELTWRGFVNQTTFTDLGVLDGQPLTFYWGVDPSADSMTIGNLAAAMMVKTFMKHGHRGVLLVGGATGLIGDPDGKKAERPQLTPEDVARNKQAIAGQYSRVFSGLDFKLVDNYDWFKDLGYLQFLREVGKYVPMRQMLGRDFVQSRLGEGGAGISYAEFSYSLIQGYDFVHLYDNDGVTLQVCGADQWGNSVAGVDLIRRLRGGEAHVYSVPLVINQSTGVKFGKSEAGAVWLDAAKTSITDFYQFWINLDDAGLEYYFKIYTELSPDELTGILDEHKADPRGRSGQQRLAAEVTGLVHGDAGLELAQAVTAVLTGGQAIGEADQQVLGEVRRQVGQANADAGASIAEALQASGLAASLTEARRLLDGGSIYINGQKVVGRIEFIPEDFQNRYLLLRRGKAFKDSALVSRA